MTMACWLDEKLMLVDLDVTIVSTRCHIMSLVTKILCDLFKATRHFNNGMWHLQLKIVIYD
jgi:hypothetical protein